MHAIKVYGEVEVQFYPFFNPDTSCICCHLQTQAAVLQATELAVPTELGSEWDPVPSGSLFLRSGFEWRVLDFRAHNLVTLLTVAIK
jgi:hypothetical protein